MKDASPPAAANSREAPGPDSGPARYSLLEICGEGGFGTVWRAEDRKLGRQIAVKRLQERLAEDPEARERFLQEAKLTSRLEHPGIVPVYDLDPGSGVAPQYSMKLVRGRTLAAAIRDFHDGQPPSAQNSVQRVQLLSAYLAVTRTMEFAHAQGVIHRDLKPQNIILGEFGETVILDWGLAKEQGTLAAENSLSGGGSNSPFVTQPGTVKGTPAYMAPEQAAGRIAEIDQRTDVYALGAILYELLSGRLPFAGKTADDMQQMVLDEEPPPPRSRDRRIPRTLEAICLRAMAKLPAARYPHVRALREDMERALADEPVSAYQESFPERLGRWARHHRGGAAAIAAALLAAIVVLSVAVALISDSRNRESAARRDADLQRDAARRQAELADSRLQQIVRETYNLELLRVRDLWQSEPSRALATLQDKRRCPVHLRDFAWGVYHRLADRGRWSVTAQRGFVSVTAAAPDGRTVAAGGEEGVIRLLDAPTGRELKELTGHEGWVIDLVFSPRQPQLFSGGADGTLREWDVTDGRLVRTWKAHDSHVNAIAIMPDGTQLFSAGADGKVKAWDAKDWQLLHETQAHEGEVLDLVVLPASGALASAGEDGAIRIWNQEWQQPRELLAHTAPVQALASLSGGNRLASGGHDGQLLIWNIATLAVAQRLHGHTNRISSLACAPDDDCMASASWDTTIRLWDGVSGQQRAVLANHPDVLLSVCLPANQSLVVSGDDGGRASAASLSPHAIRASWRDEPAILSLAFLPDPDSLAAAGGDKLLVAPRGYVHFWQLTSPPPLSAPQSPHTATLQSGDGPGDFKHTVTSIAVAAKRGWIALGGSDGLVRLWDLKQRRELRRLTGHRGYVWSVAFSPDESRLASAGGDKSIRLWDSDSGKPIRNLDGHTSTVQQVAFDPSGKWLASAGWDKRIRVWSATDGKQILQLENPRAGAAFVAFVQGGAAVLAGRTETSFASWSVPDGTQLVEFVGHDAPVSALAVSTDSKSLASADRKGVVRLWDPERGQERAAWPVHASPVCALQFSPDGTQLASADDQGAIQVWQSAQRDP